MNQRIDPLIYERFVRSQLGLAPQNLVSAKTLNEQPCSDNFNDNTTSFLPALRPIRGVGASTYNRENNANISLNNEINIKEDFRNSNQYKYSPNILKSLNTAQNPIANKGLTYIEKSEPNNLSINNVAISEYSDDRNLKWTADSSFLSKLLRTKLQDPGHNVEILRHMSSHPLHSVYSFETLKLLPELLKGIYEMGFSKPSKIQEMALPIILTPQFGSHSPMPVNYNINLIAQSQSGTGKTAAFALGILQKIDLSQSYPAQALILAPTYELALQIGEVVKNMGKYLKGLKIAYAVKKGIANSRSYENNFKNFYNNKPNYAEYLEDHEIFYPKGRFVEAHIVVGTPGSVYDWLRSGMIDGASIKMFVLDEADVMIDQQGHRSASLRINRFLNKQTCQFLLFSATYEEKEVLNFAAEMVPEPSVVLRLKREEETLDNIDQFYIPCLPTDQESQPNNRHSRYHRDDIFDAKIRVLCDIYAAFSIGQCVIFCDSKAEAVRIAKTLVEDCGHGSVALLTSELGVDQRAAVIKRFKGGEDERVLVATNVLARGIDIESVSMVINFSVPRKFIEDNSMPGSGDHFLHERRRSQPTKEPDYETYLHRIGRTGRFGRNGISFILIDGDTDDSEEYALVKAVEDYYKRAIVRVDPKALGGEPIQ